MRILPVKEWREWLGSSSAHRRGAVWARMPQAA